MEVRAARIFQGTVRIRTRISVYASSEHCRTYFQHVQGEDMTEKKLADLSDVTNDLTVIEELEQKIAPGDEVTFEAP